MSKQIFMILATLLVTTVQASVYVGQTGVFQKFRESQQGLAINKVTGRVRVEATRLMYLRECQLAFGNGQLRVYNIAKNIKPTQSHSIYLKRERLVKKISCFGSTHVAAKKLGKLKVFVLPKGKLTPVNVAIGGGAGGAGGGPVGPNVVNLPARNLNICVEKKKTILQLGTQARYWNINGRGSNLSTWKYPGTSATLTADYATANVVAYCKRRGSQRFNIHWMLNFSDPRKYYMNIRVNCVPCGDPKGVNKAQKKVDKANIALGNGKLKKAKRLLKEALDMIDKLREREVLTPEEEALIDELEEEIMILLAELGEEVYHNEYENEYEVEIVDEVVEEEKSEESDDDDDDDNFKKFLAIVGLIAGIAASN